tara:strand:+ start:101 stop:325 length:225 start_codon:yes stop_codon:yes gene_type:complete
MKTEITIKNEVNNRIFTPSEMDHVSKFLINVYKLNKDEWDKQKVTVVQAVKLALSMGAFQDDLEKKLFKNKENK